MKLLGRGERESGGAGHALRVAAWLRCRPLLSARAVAGGLLVALAFLGVLAAYPNRKAPDFSYAVTARQLPSGSTIMGDDIRMVPMSLPSGRVARAAFDDRRSLLGRRTKVSLAPGELIQSSAVESLRDGGQGLEVSIPVDSDRVDLAALEPNEALDIFVTYGSGTEARTELALAGARLSWTSYEEGQAVFLRLRVASRTEAKRVINAAVAGTVSVVRGGRT